MTSLKDELTLGRVVSYVADLGLRAEPYYLDNGQRIQIGIQFLLSGLLVALRPVGRSIIVCWVERQPSRNVEKNLFSLLWLAKQLCYRADVEDVRGYVEVAPSADVQLQARLVRVYEHYGATQEKDADGNQMVVFRASRLRRRSFSDSAPSGSPQTP